MKHWWTLLWLASTYGSGSYGSAAYNASGSSSGSAPNLIALGPVTLPDTGAGWAVLIGAAVLAMGGGLMVWMWQRRRYRRAAVTVDAE